MSTIICNISMPLISIMMSMIKQIAASYCIVTALVQKIGMDEQVDLQCSDSSSPELLVYEIINTVFTSSFVVIFSYRLHVLRSLSSSNRYKDFFPRLRVILSLVYIATSIVILAFNIAKSLFPPEQWYDYLLGAGGGACVNSIALVIELLVLRMQLAKQQPYTPFHLFLFVLLSITSSIRLMFSLIYFCRSDAEDVALSSILALISMTQLVYWGIKRQSLPQFLHYWQVNIDNILQNQIIRTDYLSHHTLIQSLKDDFPYMIPFVSVENGQLSITLQVLTKSQHLSEDLESVNVRQDKANREPLIHSQHESHSEILVDLTYSLQELKKMYIICGKFPLKKEIQFGKNTLPEIARQTQQFLQELFRQKQYYRPDILRLFRVPEDIIQDYACLLRQLRQQSDEVDSNIGIILPQDNNLIFCSVQIYKRMWILDHFVFYIRTICHPSKATSYPVKRYSEFQELHNSLKQIIKLIGRSLCLPAFPEKHLFHWNQDEQANRRKQDLQKYLKRLTNDYTLMEVSQVRTQIVTFLGLDSHLQLHAKVQKQTYSNMQIVKGQITKVIVKNKYVAFYQFKLTRNGIVTGNIQKRYSQFQELHHELQRWMHNTAKSYQFLEKPPKFFKSEADRHHKMKQYLQQLCSLPDIHKVYAFKVFLNLGHEDSETKSELSEIEAQSRLSHSKVSQSLMKLDQNKEDRLSNSSQFSKILDDLGNESYD